MTDMREAIARLIPASLKRPELDDLIGALAKGKPAPKVRTNCERRSAIIDLAIRARKRRRKIHALSCGYAFCRIEAGENPTLLLRLVTPATSNGEVNCNACRDLMGLDGPDAEAQAQEEAEVKAYKAKQARQAKRKAAKAKPKKTRGATAKGEDNAELGLDDGAGTKVAPGFPLSIIYRYKSEDKHAVLWSTGAVEIDGDVYSSPSRAAFAVTGSQVNGWARWRYVATDGRRYAIDRLRGNEAAPVRVGVTGRPPSRARAIANLAKATARVARLEERTKAARAALAELEEREAKAKAEVGKLTARIIELGADLQEEDDEDLFPGDEDEAPAPAAGPPAEEPKAKEADLLLAILDQLGYPASVQDQVAKLLGMEPLPG